MLADHSPGLVTSSLVSLVIYVVGLSVNLSDLARHYVSIPLSVIPNIEDDNNNNNGTPRPPPPTTTTTENSTSGRHVYALPVSLADWSVRVWGVVYVCQAFWLVYALVGICRKTPAGPAYNNPKLLPVQVHLFFSVAVLLQVGWLVSMDKQNLGLALLLIFMSCVFAVAALSESYRLLSSAQALLRQQSRDGDLWAIRVLAQNGLAAFSSWVIQHATLTFALFLTFGMKNRHVDAVTSSLVQLSANGFMLFVYVLSDLTVFDKFSRFVLTPYLTFLLFHAAQITKDWVVTTSATFVLLAFCTAFTFLAVFLKVITLLWRQLPALLLSGSSSTLPEPSKVLTSSRPLAPDMEEEAYLLEPK